MEHIPINVVLQGLIMLVGIAMAFAVVRMRTEANTKEIASLRERITAMEKADLVSKQHVDDHYVSKREMQLTMRNVELSLQHLQENQDRMIRILEKGGNRGE